MGRGGYEFLGNKSHHKRVRQTCGVRASRFAAAVKVGGNL